MKTKQIIKYALPVLLLAAPLVVLAQGGVQSGLSQISPAFGGMGGLASANSGTTAIQFITRIINIMLVLAGIIAVLFMVIGGYQYMTSAGNAEQAEKGKNTAVNAIIGIVIIVLSFVIINVIVNLVSGPSLGFFGF